MSLAGEWMIGSQEPGPQADRGSAVQHGAVLVSGSTQFGDPTSLHGHCQSPLQSGEYNLIHILLFQTLRDRTYNS